MGGDVPRRRARGGQHGIGNVRWDIEVSARASEPAFEAEPFAEIGFRHRRALEMLVREVNTDNPFTFSISFSLYTTGSSFHLSTPDPLLGAGALSLQSSFHFLFSRFSVDFCAA